MGISRSRSRAVVIGAGIVGAACARALARDGFRVTVVDANPPGTGATAAGMGHVPVMDDSPAQFALCRYSQRLWDQLAPTLPAAAEFERCGTLWVAADDDELSLAGQKRDAYAAAGLAARLLNSTQLAAAEPNLRHGLAGGLLLEGESVVYPPAVVKAMLDALADTGHTLRIGSAVRAIDGHRVLLADGSAVEGDAIVLAAGVGAAGLITTLPVRPRKGHLVITDRYPGFIRRQVLELGYLKSAHGSDGDSVAFNIQPRATGQLLIGSSRQYDRSDAAIDPPILRRMLARATHYMPGVAGLSAIRAWTGFRGATPDGLPLIGPMPARPGVILATGHEGLGITTSLATAELVAAHLTGRAPQIDPTPYLPSRLMHADPASPTDAPPPAAAVVHATAALPGTEAATGAEPKPENKSASVRHV